MPPRSLRPSLRPSLRIVGGTARGRRLVAPRGGGTRPTSDRVREAIFDMLVSLSAAGGTGLAGAVVADLFAGTGAMGIEALSRGAASATFVESDRTAAAAVERNLEITGLGPGRVLCMDVMGYLRARPAAFDAGFDIVFCDPPYSFDRWPDLLDAVPGRLVVAESGAPLDGSGGRPVLRDRRYGSTFVALLGPRPGD
ncbi:MAG TPA: RsmD family RNA methyltransferase [Acidimicrobiales bacterium]|nr:RsmD family RNA methyltransferase [Acidimicrobiales bacterium]